MDTDKFKILLTVLETGSMTAAAEKLSFTPSGVSRAIDSLEKELGFCLLIRDRKTAGLTKEAEELLPMINELCCTADRLKETSAKLCGLEIGRVCVGTAYSGYYPWLAETVAGFSRKYPNTEVQICQGNSTTLSEMMDERRLDFGIVSRREGRHCFESLVWDELVAIVPEQFPLESDRFPEKLLAREPFIEFCPGFETDNSMYFREIGIHPNVRFSSNNTQAVCSMIEAGLGISLLNNVETQVLSGQIRTVPLEPAKMIELGTITPPEDIISPAAKRFAEYVKGNPPCLKKA